MTRTINDQLLSQFSEFVTARFGLDFPRKRWRDLARKDAEREIQRELHGRD